MCAGNSLVTVWSPVQGVLPTDEETEKAAKIQKAVELVSFEVCSASWEFL
jgi:hypothetical protein